METTASNPARGGMTAKPTNAVRVGATAILVAAGLAFFGVVGAGTVAHGPAPAVDIGAGHVKVHL
ncbi:hypothetical protein [Microbacterium deminutum]|uniref:Uncharacterized protein n=1 Tax=Microbacterium deminutum TaxID=344164 RepID=A0ABP5C8V0_9MICO